MGGVLAVFIHPLHMGHELGRCGLATTSGLATEHRQLHGGAQKGLDGHTRGQTDSPAVAGRVSHRHPR